MSHRKMILALVAFFICSLTLSVNALAKERRGVVTFQINLPAPEGSNDVKLWLPYTMSDENQDISNVHIQGNYSSVGVYRDAKFKNNILFAQWKGPFKERTLIYSFTIKRKERVTKSFPAKEWTFSRDEFRPYLEASRLGPTEGKIKEYADKITRNQKTTLAKARAIYDWTVDNMHRDPSVKGCGVGEVDKLLVSMGGKCVDIHSVYVSLAKAAGIPAREVLGIRLPKGKPGDMTKSQHCWAEFYLAGYGWVVIDPADVRKLILEQKLTMEQAKPYREYYFGAVDENRVAFGTGRDIILNPASNNGPVNYFMYPYAEADGKPLNEDLYGFNLGYQISFKEL